MIKFKKMLVPIAITAPIVVLVSCGGSGATDEANKWSIPSKKVGIEKAPQDELIKTISKNATQFSVDNFFIDVNLKNADKYQTPKAKEELVKELNKELNNRNAEPFNGTLKLEFNANSWQKGSTFNKYFENKNSIFPYWLFFDIRAKFKDNKLTITVNVVDFTETNAKSDLTTLSEAELAKFRSQKVFEF